MGDDFAGQDEPPSEDSTILPDDLDFTPPSDLFPELAPGERIGRYVIRERLGAGGFAVVYHAEKTEPYHQHVALKIIKLGMDTEEVLARFEAERQALALMDHPHIAKIYDAGATPTGRPYFVMELVRGVPITEHCDLHRLGIEERLRLFTTVCEAVQHAHDRGIIHRDLKPSNVLVALKDQKPIPMVIDFGVAKALHVRLTDKSIFTEDGKLIGTLEYMCPEQADRTAQDIDTRADVYSLGVLLYELLTGTLPFESQTLRRAAFEEMQRIIREEEPARPSTRISRLGPDSTISARNRRVDPRTLRRELRGDLDRITLKSLEKDRTRRYDTARDLAVNVQRHLDSLPIDPPPPGPLYYPLKYLRRHRRRVVAAAVVGFLVLCVAGLVAADLARRSAAACRVDLMTAPPGAEVSLATYEPGTDQLGPARRVGVSPLRDQRVPEGRHRLTAVAPDGSFAEAEIRFAGPAARTSVSLVLKATEDVIESMVLVPGGRVELMPADREGTLVSEGQVTLPAFYLDEAEVSNRNYLAYVEATGAPRPPSWPATLDEALLDRPVVALLPAEMEAYAAWCGKRLPTSMEWAAAYRASPGRLYPWGDDPPPVWPQVAEADRRVALTLDEAVLFEHYRRYTVPVRSQPELRSPEGFYHLAGNVREVTATWDLGTGLVVIVRGGSWLDSWESNDLSVARSAPGETGWYHNGFRCARTAEVTSATAETTGSSPD